MNLHQIKSPPLTFQTQQNTQGFDPPVDVNFKRIEFLKKS